MSERDMRSKLVQALRPLDAVPVENPACPGTPDINYAEGWIECKWLRAWPKHPETPVRLDHELMPHQRAWLTRRQVRGGKAWVMLQCGRTWLLFDGVTAARILGTESRPNLMYHARKVWYEGLNVEELIEVLSGTKV